MSPRLELPAHCHHLTQKVKTAGQRTLYLSIHDDEQPAEIFLRLKGSDCSAELIALYDVVARLMSVAMQCGALHLRRWAHRITHCTSLPDLIGRHLLVESCSREDLAYDLVSSEGAG